MKYSKTCYAITGLSAESPWAVNSGFIVGNHSTLIVDTGSNYFSAKTIYGYSKSVKEQNELIVVNTEPHFDHIGGNSFFAELGVDIYAHPGIWREVDEFVQTKKDFNLTICNPARRMRNESEAFFYKTALVNPNKQLMDGTIIDLGDVRATAIATPGHTPFNMSIYVAAERVLYCGDCIVAQYLPNLEAGGRREWLAWLQSLDTIEQINPEVIVPGHGDVIVGEISFQAALGRMREVLHDAIDK